MPLPYLRHIKSLPPTLRRIIISDDVELTPEEEAQLATWLESRKYVARREREDFQAVTGIEVVVDPPTLPEDLQPDK